MFSKLAQVDNTSSRIPVATPCRTDLANAVGSNADSKTVDKSNGADPGLSTPNASPVAPPEAIVEAKEPVAKQAPSDGDSGVDPKAVVSRKAWEGLSSKN